MKFDTIEVHFKTKDGKPAKVIVARNSDVRAIVLDGKGTKTVDFPKAKGLELVGQVDDFDGPQVCYEINGVLQCW